MTEVSLPSEKEIHETKQRRHKKLRLDNDCRPYHISAFHVWTYLGQYYEN